MNKLDDGHTGILLNQFYWNEGDYPPVFLTKEDGKFLVQRISKDFVQEIPLESELLRADGVPYAEYKENSPSGNLFSFVNTTVLLEFKTPSGTIVEKEFVRNFNHMHRTGSPIELAVMGEQVSNKDWKEIEFKQIDGYSLVEINTFQRDTVVKQFQKYIDEINESKGLIVDVRKNRGGNSVYAKGIAQHLVYRDFLVGPMWKTRINNAAKKAWGSMALYGKDDGWTRSNQKYWRNNAWEVNEPDTTIIPRSVERIKVPIVILMGEQTFSAAEDFLIYTLGNKNITKIGQNSAGSSGQPLIFELPGGISARVCAKRDALPNGEDYIGIGIKPDIELMNNEDAIRFAIGTLEKG